jgi:hypothetical protein
MTLRRAALLIALFALAVTPAFAQGRGQRTEPAAEIGGDPEVGQAAPDDATPTDWSLWTPPTDGSFQTWGEAPPELGLVKRVFMLAFPEECSWALGASLDGIGDPEVYDIAYRESYDLQSDPDRLARLYRFFCNAGAYNEQHVYLLWDGSFGLKPVYFPQPSIDTAHESDDIDAPLKSITVDGFAASVTLTNSWFDSEAQTIFSHSCWRGLCDASSQAAYRFRSGSFVLQTYDADPTYDDKVNPFRIYDTSARQPIDLVPVAPEDMPTNPAWEQGE